MNNSVCYLVFVDDRSAALTELQSVWLEAHFVENSHLTQPFIDEFLKTGTTVSPLHLEGTEFQKTVWNALCAITPGTTVSYTDVAVAIGKPTAVRAVASAIAQNNISLLIPCHRVITSSGKVHKYRWGHERKKALLQWEKS
jgi:AraC family transcriptional regulator of adaptative response/methylated-DNA-[protein]-cysteine methyltransferase